MRRLLRAVPGSVYAGHRFIDVLIHGWDLAVATGQDTTLDPELVVAAHEILRGEADMVRASGVFGEDLAVPTDAGAQTRLLAFVGRKGSARSLRPSHRWWSTRTHSQCAG